MIYVQNRLHEMNQLKRSSGELGPQGLPTFFETHSLEGVWIRTARDSPRVTAMTGTEAYRRPTPSANGSSATVKSNRSLRQQSAPDGFRLKTARGALITSSLPALQNLIKRSADSYAEEFSVQWGRFGSLVRIVQLGLGGAKGDEEKLKEVTGFVCQVSFHLIFPHIFPGASWASIETQPR